MKPNKKSQNLDRKIRKKPKNINHCLIMLILTISRTFFLITITIMYVIRKTYQNPPDYCFLLQKP